MYGAFEHVTDLQYRVKSLERRVAAFESGARYVKMRSEHKAQLSKKNQEIRSLRVKLADARGQLADMRGKWMDVFDDVEKGHEKALAAKEREIKALAERALKAERRGDEAEAKLREKRKELYEALTELEEEKGRCLKLKAQLNRDYENSALPSSLKPNHKPIVNSREKTGRKPGGQPGHRGHGRKMLEPTRRVQIAAPANYVGSKDYRQTGRMVIKQMVNLHVDVVCDQYETPEYRNVRTGRCVHARFPAGVTDDIGYGGTVKAFAFLLNTRCHVSIDNVCRFLSELTHGTLNLSKGMVAGLCKEFAAKTDADRRKAFSDLLCSPVMHTDCTNARVGGTNAFVFVCATQAGAMYFAREHKGHEGVKGTPVEDYQGILVHDHDMTFYGYGTGHQECSTHVLRYLKDSMDNEPMLEWNKQMRRLLREAIHYRNCLGNGGDVDPLKILEIERRYRQILNTAKEEYEYEPPSKYYKDGYNLSVRMDKYMDCHLLFLHDRRVPPDNNLSERLLRVYKRKQKQVMTMRSFNSLQCLCSSMSMIALLRGQNKNLFDSVTQIFDRPKASPQLIP